MGPGYQTHQVSSLDAAHGRKNWNRRQERDEWQQWSERCTCQMHTYEHETAPTQNGADINDEIQNQYSGYFLLRAMLLVIRATISSTSAPAPAGTKG